MLNALIRKELLALMRDPHALAALFLMPAVFIVVMSLALKNMYQPPLNTLRYAFDTGEQTAIAKRFVNDWQNVHGPAQPLPADWPEQLRRGRLAYVITLQVGMADALVSLDTATSPVVRLRTEPGLDRAAFRALAGETAAAVGELRAAALQAQLAGISARGSQSIQPFFSADQGDNVDPLGASPAASQTSRHARPTAVQQNVPAWLVFGMFFVVTALSSLFVQEHQGGTLARLASMGVSQGHQIAAKALPYAAVNGVQAVLMLIVGCWLMPLLGSDGLSLAGIHWPALVLMLASISLAAVGFGLLLACLARSHAQANTFGPLSNLLMAALGGIMVPTFVMPALMQRIATLSPMNWGLEGLLGVVLRHGGVDEVLPSSIRLIGFGLLSMLLACWLFSRRMRP